MILRRDAQDAEGRWERSCQPEMSRSGLGWLGLSEAKPRSSRRLTNRAVVRTRAGRLLLPKADSQR